MDLTGGPLVQAGKCLGGVWILEAPELDTARKLTAGEPMLCNREVQVRPILVNPA